MKTHKISLSELIAAVPVAIDSTPSESVVAVGINAAHLPMFAITVARDALLDAERGPMTAAAIAEDLAIHRAYMAVLISYTAQDVRDGCAALEALRLEVELAIPEVELVAVAGDEWFRPGCHEEDCCPRPMVPVPQALPPLFAKEHARRDAVREARADAAEAWQRSLYAGAVADATTARRLAASLDDLCLRDWVVLTMLGADPQAAKDALDGIGSHAVAEALDAAMFGTSEPDPLGLERARAVVERVARAARGRRRQAAAHTLAAVLDWWEGNLSDALERSQCALACDEDYRLAGLVSLATARGLGPGWMGRVGQTVR